MAYPTETAPVPLVVLAAGLSMRYGRLKQLEPVGPHGEAIMDYNVFDARRAGFGEIVYIVREEIRDPIRDHVLDVFGDALPARYVVQDLARLPAPFRAPPDRRKPWGTAHAVLCAAEEIETPFAVCNADDIYGPKAFAQLYEYLAQSPQDAAMIGYPLRDTLTDGAGVTRGVCHIGRDGVLEHVVEVHGIRRKNAWIVGLESDGSSIDLVGDEMVSMNLWGLTEPLVEGVRARFRSFLDRWGAHAGREYYLSTAINDQIQAASTRVRVLHSRDTWFGLTYEEDREASRRLLADRIAAGVYPEMLKSNLAERS